MNNSHRKDETAIAHINRSEYTNGPEVDCNCRFGQDGIHSRHCDWYDPYDPGTLEPEAHELPADLSDEIIGMIAAKALEGGQTTVTPTAKGYAISSNGQVVEGTYNPSESTGPAFIGGTNYSSAQRYNGHDWDDLDDWSDVSGAYYGSTCKHDRQPYTLTDGTVIYATAYTDTPNSRDFEPDMGVYLSSDWIPDTVAYRIGWADYGLPYARTQSVLYMLRDALAWAREGRIVEVGCTGGHGRTGTALAILDVLSTEGSRKPIGGRAAIARVRANHCKLAIESDDQEWYVRACHAVIFGNPVPKRPKPKPRAAVTPNYMTWRRDVLEIPQGAIGGDTLIHTPTGDSYAIKVRTDGPGKYLERILPTPAPNAPQTPEAKEALRKLQEAQAVAANMRANNAEAIAAAATYDGAHDREQAQLFHTSPNGQTCYVKQGPDGPKIITGPKLTLDTTAGAPVNVELAYIPNPETGELTPVMLPKDEYAIQAQD